MNTRSTTQAGTPLTQAGAGCTGAIAGVTLAFILAVAFGQMEGVIVLGIILPLPLAAVGAVCGVASARHRLADALPLALAFGAGVPATFAVTTPEGPVAHLVIGSFWVTGGVLGGLARAVAARAAVRGLAEVAVGAALGLACWWLFWAYFVAACGLLNGG